MGIISLVVYTIAHGEFAFGYWFDPYTRVFLLRPDFFYLLIYKPSYCNFLVTRKKIYFFLICPPTLNIICFVEKILYF